MMRTWLLFPLMGSGCLVGLKVAVDYRPTTTAAGPRAVALELRDQRPTDQGGAEKDLVGQARAGFGNPYAVREEGGTDAAVETVVSATTEALARSGIAVSADAPRTLVVELNEYWTDGYMGYGGWVGAHFTLLDGPTALWSRDVRGEGKSVMVISPHQTLTSALSEAVDDYVRRAATGFHAPEFQQQVP